MKFKTAYERGESTYNPLGSETAPVYEYRIDKKTGKRILTQCGETNIYEKIQASHESTKIENIVNRAMAGDTSQLMAKEGQYIDISELPTNMIDLQNMILKAKGEFDKLDAETRKKFENSAEKYVSLYGSEEWLNNMGYCKEAKETRKEEIKTETKGETEE